MNVLVTGGTGFLGRHVSDELLRRGGYELFVAPKEAYDLRREDDVRAVFRWARPDLVIHLACPEGGGGIGYAAAHPGTLMHGTLMMNTLVLDYTRKWGAKFVGAGTVCSYPGHMATGTSEGDLWWGPPERTNAPYGLAKGVMVEHLAAYREEFGMKGCVLMLANLYGPGDKYTKGHVGHVIPATIMKFKEARAKGLPEITCWGTGEPIRTFLHVTDAARGIVDAAEKYDGGHITLAGDYHTTIMHLVDVIRRLMGLEGVKVKWDHTKPNGQVLREYSIEKAKACLGWTPMVPFRQGLEETIQWFEKGA